VSQERILGLLRHAEAESNVDDLLRPLTQNGIRNLEHLAQKVSNDFPAFDAIITSPALRAYHSALILFAKQEKKPQSFQIAFSLYNAGLLEYLHCIWNQPDHFKSLLIVGHNPVISETASYLCFEAPFSMAPGQMLLYSVPFSSWNQVTRNSLVLMANLTSQN
jgi:phosphohistidine phosphatase